MSALFPSGLGDLGCCHIPEAWADLVPKDGLSWGWWSWGGCASQWTLPHGPGEPALLYTGPQPPDPSRSSCSETTPTELKGCGGSELEELWKAPWVPCLLVLGFPPPTSLLRVTPPMDESTLPRVALQKLGCVQGTGIRKEKEWDTSLKCCFWHFPLWQSRNRTFPKALVPPVTRAGHKHMLPPCGHFP